MHKSGKIVGRSKKWIEFWDSQTCFNDFIWKKGVEVFVKRSKDMMSYNPKDVILDIGCGPGYLADELINNYSKYYGLDTSEKFIQLCEKRFCHDDQTNFYLLNKTNYMDFGFLREVKFSRAICLSVIQYYDDVEQVVKLINNLKKHSQANSKLLIADVLFGSINVFQDVFSVLRESVKEGFFFQQLKLLYKLTVSNYSSVRKDNGMLIFTNEMVDLLRDKTGLNIELINKPLTVTPYRKHLMITF